MPFESKAQVKWMFANKPKMAREWASETKSIKKLPVRKHRNTVSKAIPRYAMLREAGGKQVKVQVTHQYATGGNHFNIIHPSRGQEVTGRSNLTFLPGAKNPSGPKRIDPDATPRSKGRHAALMIATQRQLEKINPKTAEIFGRRGQAAIEEGRELKRYPTTLFDAKGKPNVFKGLLPLRGAVAPKSLKLKTNHAIRWDKQNMLPSNMSKPQGINVQKAYDSPMVQARFGNGGAVGRAYDDVSKEDSWKNISHYQAKIAELRRKRGPVKKAYAEDGTYIPDRRISGNAVMGTAGVGLAGLGAKTLAGVKDMPARYAKGAQDATVTRILSEKQFDRKMDKLRNASGKRNVAIASHNAAKQSSYHSKVVENETKAANRLKNVKDMQRIARQGGATALVGGVGLTALAARNRMRRGQQ